MATVQPCFARSKHRFLSKPWRRNSPFLVFAEPRTLYSGSSLLLARSIITSMNICWDKSACILGKGWKMRHAVLLGSSSLSERQSSHPRREPCITLPAQSSVSEEGSSSVVCMLESKQGRNGSTCPLLKKFWPFRPMKCI
jgi:hypothetical protein